MLSITQSGEITLEIVYLPNLKYSYHIPKVDQILSHGMLIGSNISVGPESRYLGAYLGVHVFVPWFLTCKMQKPWYGMQVFHENLIHINATKEVINDDIYIQGITTSKNNHPCRQEEATCQTSHCYLLGPYLGLFR